MAVVFWLTETAVVTQAQGPPINGNFHRFSKLRNGAWGSYVSLQVISQHIVVRPATDRPGEGQLLGQEPVQMLLFPPQVSHWRHEVEAWLSKWQ